MNLPDRNVRLWQDSQEVETIVSTSPYSVVQRDDILLVDTTSGTITITLPAAINGRKLTIVKTASANNAILQPSGSDIILLASGTTITLTAKAESVVLKAVSSNTWVRL